MKALDAHGRMSNDEWEAVGDECALLPGLYQVLCYRKKGIAERPRAEGKQWTPRTKDDIIAMT